MYKYLNIAFIILFVGSGFYLAGITSFSPVYFAFLIGVTLIMVLALNRKFPVDGLIKANFIIFVLIMSSQMLLGDILRPLTSFLCLLYFIIIFWIGNLLSYKDIIRDVIISFFFLSLIFLAEFYFRLRGEYDFAVQALAMLNVSHEFYGLKGNSIMFMDSNHVGMVILSFFSLAVYLLKEHKKNTMVYIIIFFGFILFTFSRSAIVSSIVFSAVFLFFKISRKSMKTILILPLVAIFVVYFLLPFYANDPSFLSKFGILNDVISYTNRMDFVRLFFGVGYGNSPKYLGIGTHNLIFTYYVEGGILAIILFSILYYLLIRKTIKVLYIILPFLFSGLSFAPQVQTFYFSVLAVVVLLENKKPTYA